jgi:hypothetical protein
MRWLMMAVIAVSASLVGRCAAGTSCSLVGLEASVRIAAPELTVADLLSPDTCARVRQAAARISLGAAPRAGKTRALDGMELRGLIEAILRGMGVTGEIAGQIPDRVVVQSDGPIKSCAEITRFVLGQPSSQMARGARLSGEELDCAAAQSIPGDADLELVRSHWNAGLGRREFAVRCVKPEDCVPFLLWTRQDRDGRVRGATAAARTAAGDLSAASRASSFESPTGPAGRFLVKAGQTATLRWDEGGIRVVLPVTCLEGGGSGQRVRVRLKNAARILQAEVLNDGTLRASL